jgi:hypothetical protein
VRNRRSKSSPIVVIVTRLSGVDQQGLSKPLRRPRGGLETGEQDTKAMVASGQSVSWSGVFVMLPLVQAGRSLS